MAAGPRLIPFCRPRRRTGLPTAAYNRGWARPCEGRHDAGPSLPRGSVQAVAPGRAAARAAARGLAGGAPRARPVLRRVRAVRSRAAEPATGHHPPLHARRLLRPPAPDPGSDPGVAGSVLRCAGTGPPAGTAVGGAAPGQANAPRLGRRAGPEHLGAEAAADTGPARGRPGLPGPDGV